MKAQWKIRGCSNADGAHVVQSNSSGSRDRESHRARVGVAVRWKLGGGSDGNSARTIRALARD